MDFEIEAGAFISFVGPSGSGKSTLLNMIGCLDRPSEGSLIVDGRDVSAMNRKEAAHFSFCGFHPPIHGRYHFSIFIDLAKQPF